MTLRCREIMASDRTGVIDLLNRGFRHQPREFWVKVIDRLTAHDTPAGFPKYGFLMENENVPVGVLLLIFSERAIEGVPTVWCSESSYYVEPQFRPYAAILVKRSHRYKDVTFLHLTPSPHLRLTIEARGYRCFAEGVYFGVPALAWPRGKVRVHSMAPAWAARLQPSEVMLLANHADYGGCICLVCEHDGDLHPFIFAKRRKYGLPFAYLVYSRDQNDFVRFAGPIGRYLMRRGIPLAALDTNGSIAGIPGLMTKLRPKFSAGPMTPRLGDVTYTEIPMFGII